MRWSGQSVQTADDDALPGLARLGGFVRSVRTPEFAGVTFHEVLARSVLNKVPGASKMPFTWTVNPYRGCSHACVYCYARGSHSWLELDSGRDFDTQVIVKTNVAEVLRTQLARKSWTHEPVALGTNTDPYQRAEGRYRLMPGIIGALADSGTPVSILTKGTLLRRDLPLLADAARQVKVGLGVSLAVGDPDLHRLIEPGTPAPAARLALIRAVRDAGLGCGVMVAPVLPGLTDDAASLDPLLADIAAAGATGATVLALHLRPGTREWYFGWLDRNRPDLRPLYDVLYASGSYVPAWYTRKLMRTVQPLLERHGLARPRFRQVARAPADRAPAESPPPPAAVDEPTLF